MSPASESSDTPDEDIVELQAALRDTVRQPTIEVEEIVSAILQFLLARKDKRQNREALARALANHLTAKWSFVDGRNSVIDRVIENRPRELRDVIKASDHDWFWKFMREFTPPKRKRKPSPSSDEARRKNARLAKRRHDRGRSFIKMENGLIEREFSGPPTSGNINPYLPYPVTSRGLVEMFIGDKVFRDLPGGLCLDDIFQGGDVQMRREWNCLEKLFNRSRKSLPMALPRRRVGRTWVYAHKAVLKCIEALLKEKNRPDPWLSKLEVRKFVLTGILIRARATATPEVFADFEATLSKHL